MSCVQEVSELKQKVNDKEENELKYERNQALFKKVLLDEARFSQYFRMSSKKYYELLYILFIVIFGIFCLACLNKFSHTNKKLYNWIPQIVVYFLCFLLV